MAELYNHLLERPYKGMNRYESTADLETLRVIALYYSCRVYGTYLVIVEDTS